MAQIACSGPPREDGGPEASAGREQRTPTMYTPLCTRWRAPTRAAVAIAPRPRPGGCSCSNEMTPACAAAGRRRHARVNEELSWAEVLTPGPRIAAARRNPAVLVFRRSPAVAARSFRRPARLSWHAPSIAALGRRLRPLSPRPRPLTPWLCNRRARRPALAPATVAPAAQAATRGRAAKQCASSPTSRRGRTRPRRPRSTSSSPATTRTRQLRRGRVVVGQSSRTRRTQRASASSPPPAP